MYMIANRLVKLKVQTTTRANRLCMVDGVQNRLHVGTRAKTL